MFRKIISAPLPSCAVGIEAGTASIVQLERAGNNFIVKRAATINLPEGLVQPAFEKPNIANPSELATGLWDLMNSAGLLRQRKWSIALPEAATRTAILTIEGNPTSRREVEEVLDWKIERTFGAPQSEMRLAREQITPNPQNQPRYMITAVRLSVLAEYEAIFTTLGWQAGLILPRHTGEAQWLRNGRNGDGLLLTGHDEGFTAVLMRNDRTMTVRSVFCDDDERDDALHRVLLFYSERPGALAEGTTPPVNRLLVVGSSLDKKRVSEIAHETLGVRLDPLKASEVGLQIPGGLAFDSIAAPAGLARLAW